MASERGKLHFILLETGVRVRLNGCSRTSCPLGQRGTIVFD